MNCKECTKFKTCEKARNPENYAFPSCKDFKAEQGQVKTMRERLIELLMNTPKPPIVVGGRTNGKTYQTAGNIAEYLLENGVIVLPCKVGQMVYVIEPCNCYNNYGEVCNSRRTKATKCIEIVKVSQKHHNKCLKLFERPFKVNHLCKLGKTVFFTKEEAEKALKGGEG